MEKHEIDAVKSCYSTWSTDYYERYYTGDGSYPPVHVELIKKLLAQHNVSTLLDAGCGPASFLRLIDGQKIDRYGFDLTPEMVVEAKRVLAEQGLSATHIWEGSVLDINAFNSSKQYDAGVCIGVMPHISVDSDQVVLQNLLQAVKPGGLVMVEARNQFFSLFTMNRYSFDFVWNELICEKGKNLNELEPAVLDDVKGALQLQFQMSEPPVRTGAVNTPGYDEILSRTHNPLKLQKLMSQVGFTDVNLHFYHFHCVPPFLAKRLPSGFFQNESVKQEVADDWRGLFLASAFIVSGTRPL
jgi:2-polyprenyl-3-methyl-5-hydroxy-6-metoxy-1,4-benzoquinol methylase